MVKGFISDVTLSQPILAVWPGKTVDESNAALRRIASNQVPGMVFVSQWLQQF